MKSSYFILIMIISSFLFSCTTNWNKIISASTLDNRAHYYYSKGNYEEAENLLLQVLEIRKTLLPEGKHPDYIYTLNDLAYFYYCMGDYSKAEPLYLQVLNIRKTLPPEGKHPQYAAALNNLGMLYKSMGSYNQAESLYLQALEIKKTLLPEGKYQQYANTLDNLAGLYTYMGKYNQAELLYLQAMEIRKKLSPKGKHPYYATILNNLAVLYEAMGNYSKAEPLYLQAMEIRKSLSPKGNHPRYASTLNNLSGLYASMGTYSKAESLYVQAMEIRKTLFPKGKHPQYATTLNNLAVLYTIMGNYSKAESLYLQAMEIRKTLSPKLKHPEYASTLNNLARLYEFMKNYNKAEPLYIQAMEIKKNLPPEGSHPIYANVLNNLAGMYTSMGNYNKAELLYLQAQEIKKNLLPKGKHPDYALVLSNLAELYFSMENYSKTEPLYLQALGILKPLIPEGKHPDYAMLLNNLAVFYKSMGDYNKAEPFFIQSLSIFQELLQSNFITLSENEKAQFIATIFPRFQHFYSFLEKYLPSNPTLAATATNFRLFQKAILFRSIKKIRERIRQSSDRELNDNLDNWFTLRRQINKAYELIEEQRLNHSFNLATWEEEANKLEKKLSSQSENFRLAHEQKEYTWQDVRAALKPGEAAIELIRYRVYEKKWTDTIHYAVIIIKHDSKHPEIIFLENGNTLEEEIIILYRNFMEETANNPFARADTKTCQILYTHLWQPIAAQLNGVKKVYFSPDGVYHFVNPCTLKDSNGTWLGEKREITRITSLQDIMEQKQSWETAATSPVLVGYPLYDLDEETHHLAVKKNTRSLESPEYQPITYRQANPYQLLPGSKEEVEAIARLYRKKDEMPEVWLGMDALEECIKSVDNPQVLHIATHAFFQEDITIKEGQRLLGVDTQQMAENSLLRSGLLFTGAARVLCGKEPMEGLENGILTAKEALDLNLDNTELVVLSACDTGLGEIKNGEGVYGLQRAFLVAGADAVLMSLWKVDDAAARDFMIGFYRAWLSGLSKREAYEKAVTMMKTKYKASFYWGAFVLVGE